MDTVALIPLRGGSKSIPDKNICLLAGRPLCHWVLEAACGSRSINRVFVSTDSERIAAVVRAGGFPVEIVPRSAITASDTASTESVMLEFAAGRNFRNLVTIQATSPLTEAIHFDAAIARFHAEGLDSLVTGVQTKRFFWGLDGKPINYDPLRRPRRQDFAGSMMENGAFYITRKALLESTGCRLGGRIGCYLLPDSHAIELDEPEDWTPLEKALLRRAARPQIRALIFDVDGTLTDGTAGYTARGELSKRFSLRDGKGFELLRKAGIRVAICTQENSAIVAARARKLGLADVFLGVEDKELSVRRFSEETKIPLEEIGFMGDDVNDLSAMRIAGWTACPADAHPLVWDYANYRSRYKGGAGAAREVCDFVAAGIAQ